MPRRFRLSLTLLASVLLHAVVLAALLRGQPAARVQVAPQSPVEMEVVYSPVLSKEPLVSRAEPPAPASPHAPPTRHAPRSKSQAPLAQRLEASAAPASPAPRAEDVPRAAPPALTLLPKDLLGGRSVSPEPPRGHTLHNVPGEMPDPEAVAEYQAEEARARVQGWSRDALAAARADRGALTPTLRQMQIAFSEQLVNPPPPNEALIASRNQREWADSIQRFGETGSPTVAPEKRDHRLEQRNRLQAAWVSTERPQAELTIPRIRPTRRLR